MNNRLAKMALFALFLAMGGAAAWVLLLDRELIPTVENPETEVAISEVSGGDDGAPVMVTIPSLGIAIGKYEVTQGEWRAVMGSNPAHFSACGDNCPVETVSWGDAQEFIERLNAKTGKHYRLPTAEEWYASCQAGGRHSYCGSDEIDSVARHKYNSDSHTHEVGQKQPNTWGLYDMTGNVGELTSSCVVDNAGSCSPYGSVYSRGGSWHNPDSGAQSGSNNETGADIRDDNLGFRLAQD